MLSLVICVFGSIRAIRASAAPTNLGQRSFYLANKQGLELPVAPFWSEEALRNGIVVQNVEQFISLFRKLREKQPVHVAAFGSSVVQGVHQQKGGYRILFFMDQHSLGVLHGSFTRCISEMREITQCAHYCSWPGHSGCYSGTGVAWLSAQLGNGYPRPGCEHKKSAVSTAAIAVYQAIALNQNILFVTSTFAAQLPSHLEPAHFETLHFCCKTLLASYLLFLPLPAVAPQPWLDDPAHDRPQSDMAPSRARLLQQRPRRRHTRRVCAQRLL